MKTKNLIIIIFIFFPIIVFSQKNIDDYKKLMPKFDEALENEGLNEFFSARDINFVNGWYHFEVLLRKDKEEGASVWKKANKHILSKRGYGIKKLMYFMMLNTFKIPSKKIIMQIRDFKETNYIGIYYDFETNHINDSTNLCKPKSGVYSDKIKIESLVNKKNDTTLNFDAKREIIYKKLAEIVKNYYRYKVNKTNSITAESIYNDSLIVTILNLKREVLPEDDWICRIVGWLSNISCDLSRNEAIRLYFFLEKKNENWSLTLKVDGRYGSSIWNVRDWHNCKSMNPDFVNYEIKYAKKMLIEFIEKLK